MRLFVAVFPPDDVRRDLHRRLTVAPDSGGRPSGVADGYGRPFAAPGDDRPVSPGLPRRHRGEVRLTAIDKWHVTLAFLGEVPAERLPDVERALDAVTVPKGLELRLRGGGQFGRDRSTVLWAAVDGELGPLHAQVHERLEAAGLPHDDRAFTPHLTVAYTQDAAVRRALVGYRGPSWTLHEIALVRSDPNEGYTQLRTW
ncbi:RNA 2',3'-cyclic phosphodiesterase [Actinoplanes sp. NPDC049118]|uniref:RNA 2',3'-cyclic phosphodiesterase n=1 Tax=Actinoplanes sp. NPDC049118 TaxID=3155769 RepID=UPI0033C4949B